MSDSNDLGRKGEDLASEYLRNSGYKVLHRNWRSGKNEIDIIAEKIDTVIFAEVKTRTGDFLTSPSTAVTSAKQKSIILAAETYISRFNINRESRFDVITVVKKGEEYEIEHIPDAFYPTLR